MVKIIVVAHGELAQGLVNSVEAIVGEQSNLYVVKREIGDSLVHMREKVNNLLEEVNDDDGSLILTDIVGGTPCNASAPICMSFNIEILSGVNLPMILSAIFSSKKRDITISDLAEKVLFDGQKSMINVKKNYLMR
ncbi:MAG: PTS galactosamine/N-acetylgalactosamine transporter subunit IIA [Endomicrobiia bacterium]|nr:MAG: PTS galactosamine/N-acetylgalactosamine transporter subunit IIA [Endomicrobiia bacterium]